MFGLDLCAGLLVGLLGELIGKPGEGLKEGAEGELEEGLVGDVWELVVVVEDVWELVVVDVKEEV
jgi:hypothetical protein